MTTIHDIYLANYEGGGTAQLEDCVDGNHLTLVDLFHNPEDRTVVATVEIPFGPLFATSHGELFGTSLVLDDEELEQYIQKWRHFYTHVFEARYNVELIGDEPGELLARINKTFPQDTAWPDAIAGLYDTIARISNETDSGTFGHQYVYSHIATGVTLIANAAANGFDAHSIETRWGFVPLDATCGYLTHEL